MIYAELRREDAYEAGYYTLRYLVWNGEKLIGSYGVNYKGDKPYGASRDYHRIATLAEIEARAATDAFDKLDDAEQEAHYAAGTEPDYANWVDDCIYHDNALCICDGSSLVEVITDNEQRCFEIAAMMAGVESRECPVHKHDCEFCTYIGSYRLKHPYVDDEEGYEGFRTGVPGKRVEMADVYLPCDNSGYKYIVRYGIQGEYATTDRASHYVLAPLIDGEDPYANTYFIFDHAQDPIFKSD
jgi:hypothetical protein